MVGKRLLYIFSEIFWQPWELHSWEKKIISIKTTVSNNKIAEKWVTHFKTIRTTLHVYLPRETWQIEFIDGICFQNNLD